MVIRDSQLKLFLRLVARTKTSDRRISVNLGIFETVNNSGFLQILGAHFHFHDIPDGYLDKVFSQLPGYVSEDFVPVF